MAIKNIGELGLDEITEDYLMAECEDMGAELGVDTNQGSIYRDASDGHIIRAAKFFNDLATVNEILSITTCTGDVLTENDGTWNGTKSSGRYRSYILCGICGS